MNIFPMTKQKFMKTFSNLKTNSTKWQMVLTLICQRGIFILIIIIINLNLNRCELLRVFNGFQNCQKTFKMKWFWATNQLQKWTFINDLYTSSLYIFNENCGRKEMKPKQTNLLRKLLSYRDPDYVHIQKKKKLIFLT